MNMSKIAMAACCLLLTGCTLSRSSYPATWPALVKSASIDCPDLSGRYQNLPNLAESRGHVSLYDALTNEGTLGLHDRVYYEVQLEWLDETHDALRVRLLPNDEVVTLRRSRGEFDCRDGGLTVAEAGGFTEIVTTIVSWGHYTFWPAQDGSLVAHYEGQLAGSFAFVIPLWLRGENDFRWLRVHTPEPPASTDSPDNP